MLETQTVSEWRLFYKFYYNAARQGRNIINGPHGHVRCLTYGQPTATLSAQNSQAIPIPLASLDKRMGGGLLSILFPR